MTRPTRVGAGQRRGEAGQRRVGAGQRRVEAALAAALLVGLVAAGCQLPRPGGGSGDSGTTAGYVDPLSDVDATLDAIETELDTAAAT